MQNLKPFMFRLLKLLINIINISKINFINIQINAKKLDMRY